MIFILRFKLQNYDVEDYKDINIDFQKVKNNNKEEQIKLLHKYIRLIKKKSKNFGDFNEDLFQELLLILYKNVIENYNPNKNFYNYLSKVLNNETYNFLKDDEKEKCISLENSDGQNGSLKEMIASNINLEKDFIKKEINEELYNIINNLEPFEYKILRLYYGINCSKHTLREIAEKTPITHTAIKMKLDEIKKYIKDRLIWENVV